MSRKRHKQQSRNPQPVAPVADETALAPAVPVGPRRPALSRRRRWLFRLLAATLVPAALLGLLEGGLRLFGYGYPTAFFLKTSGRNAYTTNQRFGWQFFPPAIARYPEVCEFPAVKPEGACRIFILGESAAMGTPEPAFAFGRMLEAMLRQRYPGVRFEVVNAAMTAINSNVLVPVAGECAQHKADVLIVYMGNNEVIGPYGPGSVLGRYSPGRWIIRASMFVKSWRIGQLLQNLLQPNDARGKISAEWRGMELFLGHNVTADDPRLEMVYEHFRANLNAICESARGSGAEVLLSTVATNLADCAPLAAVHRAEIDPAQREECEAHCRAGQELAGQGKHDQAVAELQRALSVDDRFADAHFCLARSLLKTGDFAQAREHFVLARDLDALRFRADSRINQTIRDVAAEQAAGGVWLVDFENALEAKERSLGLLPGNECFYEHVHLRPEGNYLLAAAVFRQLSVALPAWVRQRATGPDEPISFEVCCQRIALTGWNRWQMEEEMAAMTSRPPFTQQLDHRQQQSGRRAEIHRLRAKHATPAALDDALHVYQTAIQSNPDDLGLRISLARLLLERKDYQAAIEQWQWLLGRFPEMANWHANLGLVFSGSGDAASALGQFQEAGKINPYFQAMARYCCGNALLAQGKTSEAEQQYRQALELNPYIAKAQNALAALLVKQGKMAEAEQAFQRALEADPTLLSARGNLGELFENEDRFPEALAEYRQALDTDPADLETYDHLVRLFRKMKDPQKAVEQYRRAVEAMPESVEAHFRLGSLLQEYNQLSEAAEAYRSVLRLDPEHLRAGHNLGALLVTAGRTTEAIEQYRRVLRSHPDSAPTRSNLSRLTGRQE
jgi:tetratricopeptide (TPR) repeat protein